MHPADGCGNVRRHADEQQIPSGRPGCTARRSNLERRRRLWRRAEFAWHVQRFTHTAGSHVRTVGHIATARNHHASVFPLVHLPAAIDGTGTPHRKTKATAEAGVMGARKSPLVASTLRWGSKAFRGGR